MYTNLLGVSSYSVEQAKFSSFIQASLPSTPQLSLLEVGSGPCNVAVPLSSFFANMDLVEPNEYMHSYCRTWFSRVNFSAFNIHGVPFEKFQCDEAGYSVVIISHVLYHVSELDRDAFLDKAWACVAPGGKLIVAMTASTGGQAGIVAQYDQKRANMDNVRSWCTRVGTECSFTTDSTSVVHSGTAAEAFEKMYELVYFLVVEDAMTANGYRSLSVHDHHNLEQALRKYTWGLQTDDGTFELTMVDEWSVTTKGSDVEFTEL